LLNANDPPTFGNGPYVLTVNENSNKGASIGTIVAEDEDPSDLLSYVVYKDASMIEVSTLVGIDGSALVVLDNSSFNYEKLDTIQVHLFVTDNSKVPPQSYNSSTSVQINIVDVSEAPVWPLDPVEFSATCDSQVGAAIGKPLRTVVEDEKCKYTSEGCGGSDILTFQKVGGSPVVNISSSGILSVLKSPLNDNCSANATEEWINISVTNSPTNPGGSITIYKTVSIQPTFGLSAPEFNSTLGRFERLAALCCICWWTRLIPLFCVFSL
jgi:hypothetical protein